jgi:pimeloyl-ACP methyl ester carboxylesterase
MSKGEADRGPPGAAVLRHFPAVSADGVTLAVQGWGGAGPFNLLLVHGYGQDHRVWGRLPEEATGWGIAVFSYDLRGHGRSDRPRSAAAYQEGRRWAEDLRAVLDVLPRHPTVLVGWSYAGRIVVDYLRCFGGRDLAAITLIGASTQDGEGFLAPEVMGMAQAIALGEQARIETTLDALVPLFFHRPPPSEVMAALLQTARGAAPEALRWMNDRPLQGDALLQALDCPFLILQGEEDRVVLPAMARHMAAQVARAELVLLPGVGHMPFLEDPRNTARHLRRWLESLAGHGSSRQEPYGAS